MNFEIFAKRSPFDLNREGGGLALVLRYAGCNLQCPLCYAWRYAWIPSNGYKHSLETLDKALQALPQTVDQKRKKIVWVRIQGGEPLLNLRRTLTTIKYAAKALQTIHNHGLNHYPNTRAVIQTNAILLAAINEEQTAQIRSTLEKALTSLNKGRIIFEASFKTPSNQQLLAKQAAGFKTLTEKILQPLWSQGLHNVAAYPIAGLGPSIDNHSKYIIPIDPNNLPRETPLFHPSTWLSTFKNILNTFTGQIVPGNPAYTDYRRNPKTAGGTKTALEELEPTNFQTSWISGYANNYQKHKVNPPPINQLLRKLSPYPDKQWHALFKRHKHWLKVLQQIPTAKNPQQLLQQTNQLAKHFYPSHPEGHYPHL